MKLCKTLLPALFFILLLSSTSLAVQPSIALTLSPDTANPASPMMGDNLRFWSSITNNGAEPIRGLVAWISLVEVDEGNEQPVDLEDWSAHKAVTGTDLLPGKFLSTEWPMRLIKSGDYRVVVSVTNRTGTQVFTTPTVQFHVRQKPMLQTGSVLFVATGMPLFFLSLFFVRTRKLNARNKSVHNS